MFKHLIIEYQKNSSPRKYIFFFLTVIGVFSLMSCNSTVNNDSKKDSKLPLRQQQQKVKVKKVETPPIQSNQDSDQQEAKQQIEQAMLNPPHGQPYHRCDIPVGSPLPNQKKEMVSKPVNNSLVPTVENAQGQKRNTTGTTPRLNPPHGQPFHRCDIAVGSPLPV